MARGNTPNSLRSFAIFLEKHLTGLLAGGAFALYKRFATGKTLAQGEFTLPEHFNHRRVGRPTGAKPKRKCDLSKQAAFSFGGDGGIRTPGRFDPSTDFECCKTLADSRLEQAVMGRFVKRQKRRRRKGLRTFRPVSARGDSNRPKVQIKPRSCVKSLRSCAFARSQARKQRPRQHR